MHGQRSSTQGLPDQVEARRPLAVLGLREAGLLAGVRAAIASCGFVVADVAGAANELVRMTAYRRPRLVVAALDVLGAEPAQTTRRVLTRSPGAAMVVLSPLETSPLWLLEVGAAAVVPQTDIGELKRVLRDLHERDR